MARKCLSGGCLCGAVGFVATPAKDEAGICHCGMCCRWSGVFMVVGVEADWEQTGRQQFRYSSISPPPSSFVEADWEQTSRPQAAIYESSKWGQRLFCSQCGISIDYRMKGGSWLGLTAGVFDNPEDFRLASEIFIDKKPDFYAFANDTRRLTEAEALAQFNQ